MTKICQICGAKIKGAPFALSDLAPKPTILEVCEDCASSTELVIDLNGIQVSLGRDLFLKCNEERLECALEMAASEIEEFGWEIEEITLRPTHGSLFREPYED